jgi:hypothetical protein
MTGVRIPDHISQLESPDRIGDPRHSVAGVRRQLGQLPRLAPALAVRTPQRPTKPLTAATEERVQATRRHPTPGMRGGRVDEEVLFVGELMTLWGHQVPNERSWARDPRETPLRG